MQGKLPEEKIQDLFSMPDDSIDDAVRAICSSWPAVDLIGRVADMYWDDLPRIKDAFEHIKTTPLAGKEVKTIGLYYYDMHIGGAQKVVYLMGNMLVNMGYKVVLITDDEPGPWDSVIEGVDRVFVQCPGKTNRENYILRAAMWDKIIDEYKIDLILNNTWTSYLLMFDTVLFKLKDIPSIAYTHTVFAALLSNLGKAFYNQTYSLSMVDGMIVLSEADAAFWSVFNDNVYHLPNPVDPKLLNISHVEKPEARSIIWIGRIAPEKGPMDAIKVMDLVVKELPDAVMYMVGGSVEGNYTEECVSYIDDHGLKENVIMTGFQSEPDPFYQRSKILLNTSRFEGYPMVLIEAAAYGLPVVMYDIYHIDLAKDAYGVTTVPQGDIESAASEIIKLLSEEDYYRERHELVEESFSNLREFDFEETWRNIIRGKKSNVRTDRKTSDMVRLVRDFYMKGCIASEGKEGAINDIQITDLIRENNKLKDQLINAEENNKALEKKYQKKVRTIKESKSYKLASVFRKIRHPFR